MVVIILISSLTLTDISCPTHAHVQNAFQNNPDFFDNGFTLTSPATDAEMLVFQKIYTVDNTNIDTAKQQITDDIKTLIYSLELKWETTINQDLDDPLYENIHQIGISKIKSSVIIDIETTDNMKQIIIFLDSKKLNTPNEWLVTLGISYISDS